MTSMKQTILNASTATAELITKVLARFPRAQIKPRPFPLSDEDISLDVVLPMSMNEIYQAREWLYDVVIELQDRYEVLISASAIPQERQASINP